MPSRSAERLPLGRGSEERRMTHEQVPDDGAYAFGVRSHALLVHRRDEDAHVGHATDMAAVASEDSERARADTPGEVDRADEVGRDAALRVAASDREDEQRVPLLEAGP